MLTPNETRILHLGRADGKDAAAGMRQGRGLLSKIGCVVAGHGPRLQA
jgi:hypothetical protein